MEAPLGELEEVVFAVAGDAENRRDAVAVVKKWEIYDTSANPQPVAGGVHDPRMGTIDSHYTCVTCRQGRRRCPGHPGRLEMRAPLPSPMFINEIRRWLRVVCHECGTLMVDASRAAGVPASRRFATLVKTDTKGAACPGCGAIHPTVVKVPDDSFGFEVESGPPRERKTERLSPARIRAILERVTDATVAAVGRPLTSHPRRLMVRDVLIAPNTIRPGVRMGAGPVGPASHHDLTNVIRYLVKQNSDFPDAMPERLGPELERRVQLAEQVYFEMIVGSPLARASSKSNARRSIQVGSRPTTSIARNFARKQGRFRRNLLGKRSWRVGRSTISGNPHLKPDEVGVPVAFARVLQVEETVQEHNRERLRKFYLNGAARYPGCSRIVKRSNGRTYRVESLGQDARLEIGDVVFRDVVDGDFAHLNRQPSLERSSIGVHRVVIIHDPDVHTLQLNVLACANYNADFDGDQMNIWVSHSIMARVEAEIMSSFANWFISSKNGVPVNGEIQDSVIGSFELTRDGVEMDKLHLMRLFSTARVEPPDLSGFAPDHLFSGRDAVSFLLAETPINYVGTPTWFDKKLEPYLDYSPSEIRTEIRQGKMLSGVLDKRSIGEGAGSGIFHQIASDYGPRKALDLVFALQQVSINFLRNQGFTVSASDMILSPEAQFAVQAEVAALLADSKNNLDRLIRGDLTPPIGMTTREYFERLQIEALKTPDSVLGPILDSMVPDQNGLFKMIGSGSKGKKPNLVHISGTEGQTEINNARVAEQFGYRRANVFFPAHSTDPRSRGFIPDNYIVGMDSRAAIAAAKAARHDLISKALATAVTGFLQRKSTMANQGSVVDNHRRLVKDQAVVQLLYGEDGLDPRRAENVRFRSVQVSDDRLRELFYIEDAGAAQPDVDAAFAAICADRVAFRRALSAFQGTRFGPVSLDIRAMPVDVARAVRDSKISHGERKRPAPPKELSSMIRQVADFCRKLVYVHGNEAMEAAGRRMPVHLAAATAQLQMLVRAELSPPILSRLEPAQLAAILETVRFKYAQALIDYGTAAGIIATQAVSEPLIQYMLDSHHRSVGSGTDTAGIQRPLEIMAARPPEAERSPEMKISPLPEFEHSEAKVAELANQIELMPFERFVASWALLLEPIDALQFPTFSGDRRWIADFLRHHPLLPKPTDLTNWCMRFVLNKSEMVLKGMDLATIVERLRAVVAGAYVVHTSENVSSITVRVWLRAPRRAEDISEEKVLGRLRSEVLPAVIRGVPRITNARVVPATRFVEQPDGSFAAKKVFAVATTGSNIYGVLLNPMVDPTRVVSSSIGETIQIFGLAAGRDTIVREIRRFMGASAPSERHLQVYADEMVRTGRWTSLEFRGIKDRERKNVLLRMGASAPRMVLEEAALNNTSGKVSGLIPSLIAGRAPALGTTWNTFVVDEDYVRENTRTVDSVLDTL